MKQKWRKFFNEHKRVNTTLTAVFGNAEIRLKHNQKVILLQADHQNASVNFHGNWKLTT